MNRQSNRSCQRQNHMSSAYTLMAVQNVTVFTESKQITRRFENVNKEVEKKQSADSCDRIPPPSHQI